MADYYKRNSKITFIKEGLRIFSRNIKVKFRGLEKYPGTDEEICHNIIRSCYDGDKEYLRASAGNYIAFYSRDFGWCIESLIRLGYAKEVNNTLRYALSHYANVDGIRVAISREDVPYDFPDKYSPDSVAYIFRSLRISKSKELISKYISLLNSELKKFEEKVIDKTLGIVKNESFSGMRDHAICKASCYDMIMACMLCDEVDKINKIIGKKVLNNVLKKYDLKNNLIKYYWTGKYFRDSINTELCTGHANVYPYVLGIITDKKMLKSSIKSIIKNRLDKPLPLKYGYDTNTKFISYEWLAKDWEKDTVWAMLGLAYIQAMVDIDNKRAMAALKMYEKSIKSNKGFIEVYDAKGKPYNSLFYTTDNSMLWAAIYLDLKRKTRLKNA